MTQRERLEEILLKEFGIENSSQLRKAVFDLGGLDVSVFCAAKERKRRKNGKSHRPDIQNRNPDLSPVS